MNIAVFLPNWIGDVVMATPALRALRQHFAGARFLGVMKPYVAGVLEGSPWLDGQVFLESKGPREHRWPAAAYSLRKEKVDLAILFSNTFRSALTAWLGNCQRRIGYSRYARFWLLTDRLAPRRGSDGRLLPSPIIDAYNLLAKRAGCPELSYRMELFTTQRDEELADKAWEKTRLGRYPEVLCLNPGAAFGSSKHWSTEAFAALAQQVVDQRDSGVLVLCGPSEVAMAREIVALANRPGVVSLAGQILSVGLTKACVRRSDLLITTDSGPRHFAAAFQKPVVTLFGPTHIAWTETYYSRALHLQKKVDCGPCQRRVCPFDHRCMKLLTPTEVFQAATRLLDTRPSRTDSRQAG